MKKKIIELLSCTEAEADFYVYAHINNFTHLLKDDKIKSMLEELDVKIEDNRTLYDSIVKELESRGISNKKLLIMNGYNTIVYSRTLGQYLNKYCRIHGVEIVVDILEEYFKNGLKKGVKTTTLLNFFKDINGGGINYYIERDELLF